MLTFYIIIINYTYAHTQNTTNTLPHTPYLMRWENIRGKKKFPY